VVCPSPGNRGSTHPCSNIINVGKIISAKKLGKVKNKKGKSPGEGNPWANG
jgi:hypothetical protein